MPGRTSSAARRAPRLDDRHGPSRADSLLLSSWHVSRGSTAIHSRTPAPATARVVKALASPPASQYIETMTRELAAFQESMARTAAARRLTLVLLGALLALAWP